MHFFFFQLRSLLYLLLLILAIDDTTGLRCVVHHQHQNSALAEVMSIPQWLPNSVAGTNANLRLVLHHIELEDDSQPSGGSPSSAITISSGTTFIALVASLVPFLTLPLRLPFVPDWIWIYLASQI